MKKIISILTLVTLGLINTSAMAGGMALGGTRIIYPQDSQQVEVSTKNTSDKSTFLVQSWVDTSDGNKASGFFVTPTLFVSGPGHENKLRLIYSGKELPKDRESLFYFNSKAVPSVDKKETENKNILVIAATTRVKIFVRPEGLSPSPEKAPKELKFSRSGKQITITNPTPYYITIGEMKIGGSSIKDALMIPPKGSLSKAVSNTSGEISVSTINDFGAYSSPMKFVFE